MLWADRRAAAGCSSSSLIIYPQRGRRRAAPLNHRRPGGGLPRPAWRGMAQPRQKAYPRKEPGRLELRGTRAAKASASYSRGRLPREP